jgi:DNA polymerase I-like protein with 3'-5' exonuclease and polymerase domains
VKLGMGVGLTQEEEDTLWDTKAVESYVKFMKKTFKDFTRPDNKTLSYWAKGKQVKDAFLSGVTGLKELQADLKEEAAKFGFIIAIDGRKLYIRKAHAALNQLLQGGGAVVCKVWMRELQGHLKHQEIPFTQMAWVHDECQIEHPGEGAAVANCSRVAMKDAQRILDFKGELDTDSKTGRNWMECH